MSAELSLRHKKELHEKLMKILERKLKEKPNDPFILSCKEAELRDWAKIESKMKELPPLKSVRLRTVCN